MPVLIGIIVALIVIIVIWYIATMNKLRALEIKVTEADSGIDVALTKRYDVLTKQLDVVRAYMKHETELITETIRLRSNMSMAEKIQANAQMDELNKQINLVAEAYPDLRSSQNFVALQASINDVEEHLQAARRLYNANVSSYNTAIVMFPASIVAGNLHATPKQMFEAEAHKRNDVQMTF